MTQLTSESLERAIASVERSKLTEHSAAADRERADIQRLFPLDGWPALELERYALGQQTDGGTYCHWLEFNSIHLGGIGGGSALKHVIYRKKDGSGWYFPSDYPDEKVAWKALRGEFCRAFELANQKDWAALDQLPHLKNKALLIKSLHLYFPDEILPIASGAHLMRLFDVFGVQPSAYKSLGRVQQNRLLLTTVRARAEFNGWNNSEIAHFLYLAFDPRDVKLAFPFDQMFADLDEAEWAFDLILDTARKLGISDPGDPRWAVTSGSENGFHHLRVIYASWAALGIDGKNGKVAQVMLALLDGQYKDGKYLGEPFREKPNGNRVRLIEFPVSAARPFADDVRKSLDETLEAMRAAFSSWRASSQKTAALTDVQRAIFDATLRESILREGLKKDVEPSPPLLPPPPSTFYIVEACAADLCMDVETIQTWVRHIERKRQAVLYGPPGTGKTFAARALAKHLVSGGDGIVDLIQFHPAYAYEDFIQGLRPQARADGGLDYVLVKGRFLEFCDRARRCKDRCVLIIDEFNRANLARVFGELMYLLEYRNEEVPLAGGNTLRVPDNVLIIGTMNTADRSIALVDHALRRRFAFIHVPPNYESLREFHQRSGGAFDPDHLIVTLQKVNERIKDPHYAIGVSFFMVPDLAARLPDIWRTEIEPYLEEYFFDSRESYEAFRWEAVQNGINPKPSP